MEPYLAITEGKGFSLKFQNGWRVSVQFGWGNYHDKGQQPVVPVNGWWDSPNAEVAVFNPAGYFEPLVGGDNVCGWVTPDKVASLIARVSKFKREYIPARPLRVK